MLVTALAVAIEPRTAALVDTIFVCVIAMVAATPATLGGRHLYEVIAHRRRFRALANQPGRTAVGVAAEAPTLAALRKSA